MKDADIKEINRVRKIYSEWQVFDQTLIPNNKQGDAFKMRVKGALIKDIAEHYGLSSTRIRQYIAKSARLARTVSIKGAENGNGNQEIPSNDIREIDVKRSGYCESGYILRLRDIARNLSSQ